MTNRNQLRKLRRLSVTAALRRVVFAVFVALVAMVGVSLPAHADEKSVVVMRAAQAVGAAAVKGSGAQITSEIGPGVFQVEAPGVTPEAAAASLSRRAKVEWAEPVIRYYAADAAGAARTAARGSSRSPRAAAVAADVKTSNGLQKVDIASAWSVTTGSPSMSIAVIDSGVDAGHPDLAGRVVTGPNFSTEASALDNFGHGTHVAGIIAAQGSGGRSVGVVGVDWHAKVTSIKVLDRDGAGENIGVARSLYWAADNGIRIANLSLSGVYSRAVADAVSYAQSRGVVVVAAAGNEGNSSLNYPAAFPGVISVGNSSQNDSLGYESTFGPWVQIFAPGEDVLSTWPRNLRQGLYRFDSGTSMASPVVAGAASLLWAARPYLSAQGVAQALESTTDQMQGGREYTASGRLNVGRALSPIDAGYRFAASDGGVFTFGSASFGGSAGGTRLTSRVVAQASDGTSNGYWLFAADGGVFSYGGAAFYGSAAGTRMRAPIATAMATRSGAGYWIVGADGAVYPKGDAQFYGSLSGVRLNKPIVGAFATATGRGYWLIASDGGVFSFGDAGYFGSTGSMRLNKPIVGGARNADGSGYWLVASDGGIFTFGSNINFYGSTGSMRLNQPIVAMSPTSSGLGYDLIASDGGVFTFGDAQFRGSTGSIRLNQPIVSGASAP